MASEMSESLSALKVNMLTSPPPMVELLISMVIATTATLTIMNIRTVSGFSGSMIGGSGKALEMKENAR